MGFIYTPLTLNMPRDADFLSPRDILINDNFCLKLASFKQLANVIVKTENLPRDDDSLRQKTGFWESGYQIVRRGEESPDPAYQLMVDTAL